MQISGRLPLYFPRAPDIRVPRQSILCFHRERTLQDPVYRTSTLSGLRLGSEPRLLLGKYQNLLHGDEVKNFHYFIDELD